jgi:hypothetical protein
MDTYKKVWKRPTEAQRDKQIREAIAYCYQHTNRARGNLGYAPGERVRETQTVARPTLQLQLAREAASFDLEMDCWVALCHNGWTCYGRTAEECERNRADQERIVRKHAQCNPQELAW